MRLLKLEIENFKGIKSHVFTPDGLNAIIRGNNATGKTTVEDAFMWLFTDKNAEGASKFGIKPYGSFGQGLETKATATIAHGADTYIFGKTYSEKWTTKRGSATPVFDGHDIVYYVDGLRISETEFKVRVASLIPAAIFAVITSPEAFPRMKDVDQRKMLFDMIGEMSDDEIISANEILAPLADRGRHSVEEYRKMMGDQKTKLAAELRDIPIRMAEAQRFVGSEINIPAAETHRDTIQSEIDALRSSLVVKPDEMAERRRSLVSQLNTLESDNNAYKARARSAWEDERATVRRPLRDRMTKIGGAILEQQTFRQQFAEQVQRDTGEIERMTAALAAKNRASWDGATVCPTCKRDLPASEIERARREFNTKKATEAESMQKGIDDLQARMAGRSGDIEKFDAKIADLEKEHAAVDAEMKADLALTFTPADMPDYMDRRAALQRDIDAIDALPKTPDDTARIADINTKIDAAKAVIANINRDIASTEQSVKSRQRVEDLTAQRASTAAKAESVDARIFLCGEFDKIKAGMVEAKVNGLFDYPGLSFKLFNQQINGGITPCCEVTVDGVPYSDLNNAGRINAGLSIINTLTRHYGFDAPVFIDNAEAVVDIWPIESQVIRLVVDGSYKSLYTEVG